MNYSAKQETLLWAGRLSIELLPTKIRPIGNELVEITACEDEVNVAARLASQAAAGEVVLSESTVRKAGLDTAGLEKRRLALKGKSEPMDVWVLRVIQN
jgi:class 3 adenylate cyclase